MTKYTLVFLAALLSAPLLAQDSAEPPLAGPVGITILGPALTPAPPSPTGAAIVVAPGRFLPIAAADGSPSYIAPSAGYTVFRVKPGFGIIGIKYDAPANAKEAVYEWPDVKSPVYCLIATHTTGTFPVQLVRNGPTEVGPVENGSPIQMQVGQLPIPPPVPPGPVPPGPTPPDGPLGLTKASREGAAKVSLPPAAKAVQAQKLAAAHRSLKSALAAGAYNTQASNGRAALAAAILADKRAANNAAVGAEDWKPWASQVDAMVSALYQSGQISTVQDWQAALEELAVGLGG